MIPLIFVAIFTVMFTSITIKDTRESANRVDVVKRDQLTLNFMGYREGALNYLRHYPAHTGVINRTQIASYLPLGLNPDDLWSASVHGGRLYTYSQSRVSIERTLLIKSYADSIEFGVNRGGVLRTITSQPLNQALLLPSSVPEHAVVIVDRI